MKKVMLFAVLMAFGACSNGGTSNGDEAVKENRIINDYGGKWQYEEESDQCFFTQMWLKCLVPCTFKAWYKALEIGNDDQWIAELAMGNNEAFGYACTAINR